MPNHGAGSRWLISLPAVACDCYKACNHNDIKRVFGGAHFALVKNPVVVLCFTGADSSKSGCGVVFQGYSILEQLLWTQ
jgi:hypothetical protein